MTVRYRPGLSFQVALVVERRAACVDGEHDWKLCDPTAEPKYYRCLNCRAYGFIRRKGGALRNGRYVLYICSTKGCSRPARIRSRYRHTGGAFEWACCPGHAAGKNFETRVTEEDVAYAAIAAE